MGELCAASAVGDSAWSRGLSAPERAVLFAVLFGDAVPLRPEQALAGSWLLEEAARREVAQPGAKRSVVAAVAAAGLGAAERALLDRVSIGPVRLAAEAAPVAAVEAAHALNVAALAAGGWGVVALVAGHLVYRPRACGAAPPSSTRAALHELAARDAVLGRWWVASPASVAGAAVVEVVARDAGDLGARVEVASARAAATGARRVAVVVGELALVDVCPQPADRIARWTGRWRAEELGGRVGRSGRSALDEAPDPPASAWAWRATLESVPRSGPPATTAIVGPPAFDQRWQARDGLVLRADGSVAERQTMGRPRAVSLEAVCAALLAAQAEGLEATEPEIRRRLRAQGHTVSRGSVLRRLREIDHLFGALDDELVAAGLGAVAAVEARGPGSCPLLVPYAGSKRPLLDELVARLPASVERYCEVALGSGALFLHLASQGRIREAVLSDADPDIVHLWQWVQRAPRAVLAQALLWQGVGDRAAYFRARAAVNGGELGGVERAGALLYLMWASFNGLFRRGGHGGLNMPPGERRGEVGRVELTVEAICEISELLALATIRCGDAADVIETVGEGWVVYVDPPYWPVKGAAKGFCSYGGRGFSAGDLVRMVWALWRLAARGGFGLLSNASVAPVVELCEGADVSWVATHRWIARTVVSRGRALEVIARFTPKESVSDETESRVHPG